MGYSTSRFSSVAALSGVVVFSVLYLVLSSQVAMALMPVLGTGGLYAEAEFLEADQGTIYPEYEDDNSDYNQLIGTTTPECGGSTGGIPMIVVELDGEARATGFFFRKDVQIPFIQEQFMSLKIGEENPVALSGNQLKLFTSQLGGDSLLLRNVRVNEGGPGGGSTEKWGANSGEFYLEGGQGTDSTVPGLKARNISAWLHGATGQQITLEAEGGSVNIDLSFPKRTEVFNFYADNRFGYTLEDQNPDLSLRDYTDDRVERGIEGGGAGYFPCDPSQLPVEAP
jgi:hypothetical protein